MNALVHAADGRMQHDRGGGGDDDRRVSLTWTSQRHPRQMRSVQVQ
jgi:hypothetical protein